MIIRDNQISTLEQQRVEKSRNTILKLNEKAKTLHKMGYTYESVTKLQSNYSKRELQIIRGILIDYN